MKGYQGSIGAWPVFASVQDIPAPMLWPGARFAVPTDTANLFTVYEVQVHGGPDGLSGFWSTLAAIGGAVAAPFTAGQSLWVTAAVSGGVAAGQAGAAMLDARNASSAQKKEIGKLFDQMAGQVTQIFNEVQSKPSISAADLKRAEEAYAALAAAAEQYGPVEYVSRQWTSAPYKTAYETRLGQMREAVAQSAAQSGGVPVSGAPGATGAPGAAGAVAQLALESFGLGGFPLWAVVLVVVLLLLVLRRG